MNSVPVKIKAQLDVATLVDEWILAAVKDYRRTNSDDRLDYVCRNGRGHELTLDAQIDLEKGVFHLFPQVLPILDDQRRLVGFEILPLAEPKAETDEHLRRGVRLDFRDLADIVKRCRTGAIVELFSAGNFRRDLLVRKTVARSLFKAFRIADVSLLAAADVALGISGAARTRAGGRGSHRLTVAVYSEIARNIFGRRHAPILALFAAMPPSRVPFFAELLTRDNPQDIIDKILQLPILILFPEKITEFFARKNWRQRDILDELKLPRAFRNIGLQPAGSLLYLYGPLSPRQDIARSDLGYITEEALRHCPSAGFRAKLGVLIAGHYQRVIGDDARAAKILEWAWIKSVDLRRRGDVAVESCPTIAAWIAATPADLQNANVPAWNSDVGLTTAAERARLFEAYRMIAGKNGASQLPFPARDWMPINSQLPDSSLLIARVPNEALLFVEAERNKNCAYRIYGGEAKCGIAAIYVLRRRPNARDPQNKIFLCPILGHDVVNIGMARLYRRHDGGVHLAECKASNNGALDSLWRAPLEKFCA